MAEQKSKKNSELMKSYERIRSYMRRFYVYGFESKVEFSAKLQDSKSKYEQELRRIQSWLGDYMDFRNEHGRIWFITVDASSVSHNPLYESWKAKSFTDYDIMLHFYLLDILRGEKQLTKKNIENRLHGKNEEHKENVDYLGCFDNTANILLDSSTVDKKLKEYCRMGLLNMSRKGRNVVYSLTDDKVELSQWQAAAAYFSETAPLGECGSFMLDKLPAYDFFNFKHHFFLYTLDSGILCKLLEAMEVKKWVQLKLYDKKAEERLCCPFRFYCSTQTGRQYVLCYDKAEKGLRMYRLDRIKNVKQKAACESEEYDGYLAKADKAAPHIWGVSLMDDEKLEHLEFTVYVGANEDYILKRLQREKRRGEITKVDAEYYRFSIDVYDARELLPWLRTFIMRITDFKCSNELVVETFKQDLQELVEYYGEGGK